MEKLSDLKKKALLKNTIDSSETTLTSFRNLLLKEKNSPPLKELLTKSKVTLMPPLKPFKLLKMDLFPKKLPFWKLNNSKPRSKDLKNLTTLKPPMPNCRRAKKIMTKMLRLKLWEILKTVYPKNKLAWSYWSKNCRPSEKKFSTPRI